MIHLKRPPLALFVLLLSTSAVGAQAPTTAAPSRNAIEAAARAIMEKATLATFVTLDASGAPQSRIVEPFPLEPRWIIWIATTSASRKIAEVTRDPRVALTYLDPSSPGYVTFTGEAAVVRDPAEKAKRWKQSWSGFYKNQNRGDDYTLIRVTAMRLEISNPSRGMINDPLTWKPVTLILR